MAKGNRRPTDPRNYEKEELERRAMRLFRDLAKGPGKCNINEEINKFFDNPSFPNIALETATLNKRKYELIANAINLSNDIGSSLQICNQNVSEMYNRNMTPAMGYNENSYDFDILSRYKDFAYSHYNNAVQSRDTFSMIEWYLIGINMSHNASSLMDLSRELKTKNLFKYIN